MYAAGFGTVDAVKLLLAKGADVNAKNQFDMTALLFGAGNHEKARLLIEKGADVNAKTKGGRTPLMIASACDGCSPTVKLLLDKGADPKAVDAHKIGALQIAADANDLESMKVSVDRILKTAGQPTGFSQALLLIAAQPAKRHSRPPGSRLG